MHIARRFGPVVTLALALLACDETIGPEPTGPDASRQPDHNGRGGAIGLEEIAIGLSSPVHLEEADDRSGRLFVADQPGQVRIIDEHGNLLPEPFLDISGRIVPLNPNGDERGLLGLALHPRFAGNGRFFVYYSAPLRAGAPANFNHTSVISEFTVSGGSNQADPASERILLQVDQPQGNHNAGMIAFGPRDGMLYISLGDGGSRDDDNPVGHVEDWYEVNAGGNGQDIEANLLGNILRIDVDRGSPYGIPWGNPYVGKPGLDEIWAYGFRNPYRFSFDMGGRHDLLVGDAGQERWEEVSLVTRGGNYGWNVKEGTHCFDAAAEPPFADLPSCPRRVTSGIRKGDRLIDPVIEYPNAKQGGLGRTVVGGYVYRGDDVRRLRGKYIFGDYTTNFAAPDGSIFMAHRRGRSLWRMEQIEFPGRPGGRLGLFVKGFGQDADGEVYILASGTTSPFGTEGVILRLTEGEDEDEGEGGRGHND